MHAAILPPAKTRIMRIFKHTRTAQFYQNLRVVYRFNWKPKADFESLVNFGGSYSLTNNRRATLSTLRQATKISHMNDSGKPTINTWHSNIIYNIFLSILIHLT